LEDKVSSTEAKIEEMEKQMQINTNAMHDRFAESKEDYDKQILAQEE
jgi:hypothetical protein